MDKKISPAVSQAKLPIKPCFDVGAISHAFNGPIFELFRFQLAHFDECVDIDIRLEIQSPFRG